MPIQPGAVPAGQTSKKSKVNRNMQYVFFLLNKFSQAGKIFKEQKILNIYRLNILTNIIFVHRVENNTAPSTFATFTFYLATLTKTLSNFKKII